MWIPSSAKILDQLCMIKNSGYDNTDIMHVKFSSKIKSPPPGTINIITNLFKSKAQMGQINQYNSSFGSSMLFYDILPETIIVCNISAWAVNAIIMSGCVEKDGWIKEGSEFSIVTYSGHHSVVIKDSEVYKKIKK